MKIISTKKKKWKKPLLTILVRSKPEETVLAGCKNVSVGSSLVMTAGMCAMILHTEIPGRGCDVACQLAGAS